jgi:hypothetical protein
MSPRRPGPATDHEAATSPAETGGTITATRDDGPLEGESIEADVVEGRPPKIIDVHVDHGSTCRHCLADWRQTGSSAVYPFEIGRLESAPAPRQGAPRSRRQAIVVRELAAQLADEKRGLRDEVAALETALAAAHGELLELRRQLAVGQPRRAA